MTNSCSILLPGSVVALACVRSWVIAHFSTCCTSSPWPCANFVFRTSHICTWNRLCLWLISQCDMVFFCRLVLTYGLYPLEEQLIVPQHHIFCCVLVLDEGVSCWVILCPMMHCCWTTAPEAGSPISLVYNYETVPVYVNLRKYGPRAK